MQGGYTWTVTYLTAVGDQPPLPLTNLLTGYGTAVTGATLLHGNFLNGTFKLGYGGLVTPALPFNVSAAALATALLPLVGTATVTSGPVSSEGGTIYSVTFKGLPGDVSLLTTYFNGTLLGQGAVVAVREARKGALASGSALRLSYAMPLYCSQSQVQVGSCGAPLHACSVEVYTSRGVQAQTLSVAVDYGVQIVRTAAPSLEPQVFFDQQSVTGAFQLTYNGAVSGRINAHASEADLRSAIEALPDVHAVAVARSYSADALPGSAVNVAPGALALTCALASGCDFKSLPPGELVRVNGLWFKVGSAFAGSAATLPLALVNDSTAQALYSGAAVSNAPLYRWARGYEWTVTFLSVNGARVLPMGSPYHGLNPEDTTVAIRAADCAGCVYVGGLLVGQPYTLRLRCSNADGFGPYSTTTATPLEIPGPPSGVVPVPLSSCEILVTFYPPTGFADGINQYLVQWDTLSSFKNALTASASCLSVGFGACAVTGIAIAGVPPFSYKVERVVLGVTYYIRVSAANAVSTSQLGLAGTGDIADNTRWSNVVTAVPADQPPSAPLLVVPAVAGPNSLQIVITPPLSGGGCPGSAVGIDTYLVEWDVSSAFDAPSSYGNVSVPAAKLLPALTGNFLGQFVYDINGLTTGTAYWVRVSAHNQIGYSPVKLATQSAIPSGKPGAPSAVTLSTDVSSSVPISWVNVSWTAPKASGGTKLTGYFLELWEPVAVPEVQQIQFIDTTTMTPSNGAFYLFFGPTQGFAYSTEKNNYDTTAANIRSQLDNLGYAQGFANRFQYSFPIGDVKVSSAAIPNMGTQWLVTFTGNVGDQVPIVPQMVASGTSSSVIVSQVVSGRRPNGYAEQQIVTILAQGTNSTADLGGFFTLAFNNSVYSTAWLPVTASAARVQRGISQLNTLRAVSVTRTTVYTTRNSLALAGYRWAITFSGDVGNMPALVLDASYLTTTRMSVVATVDDGDNSIDTATNARATNAVPGELPAFYRAALVGPETRSFTWTSLTPGHTYLAKVSAQRAAPTTRTAAHSPTHPPLRTPLCAGVGGQLLRHGRRHGVGPGQRGAAHPGAQPAHQRGRQRAQRLVLHARRVLRPAHVRRRLARAVVPRRGGHEQLLHQPHRDGLPLPHRERALCLQGGDGGLPARPHQVRQLRAVAHVQRRHLHHGGHPVRCARDGDGRVRRPHARGQQYQRHRHQRHRLYQDRRQC